MRLLCVICGLLTSLSAGRPDCISSSVRDLALRAEVVFEGVLEEFPDRSGYETEPVRVLGVKGEMREPVPGAGLHQSRVRVHRVWEIKAGELRKNTVVVLIGSREDQCLRIEAKTRYLFFTKGTGDASVLCALSPPVQSKRAFRKDISHVLCQTCGVATANHLIRTFDLAEVFTSDALPVTTLLARERNTLTTLQPTAYLQHICADYFL